MVRRKVSVKHVSTCSNGDCLVLGRDEKTQSICSETGSIAGDVFYEYEESPRHGDLLSTIGVLFHRLGDFERAISFAGTGNLRNYK